MILLVLLLLSTLIIWDDTLSLVNSIKDGLVSYTKPSFIELTKDNVSSQIINVDNNRSTNSIKLSYKDVTLEFNNDQLEMVLGIIRRW